MAASEHQPVDEIETYAFGPSWNTDKTKQCVMWTTAFLLDLTDPQFATVPTKSSDPGVQWRCRGSTTSPSRLHWGWGVSGQDVLGRNGCDVYIISSSTRLVLRRACTSYGYAVGLTSRDFLKYIFKYAMNYVSAPGLLGRPRGMAMAVASFARLACVRSPCFSKYAVHQTLSLGPCAVTVHGAPGHNRWGVAEITPCEVTREDLGLSFQFPDTAFCCRVRFKELVACRSSWCLRSQVGLPEVYPRGVGGRWRVAHCSLSSGTFSCCLSSMFSTVPSCPSVVHYLLASARLRARTLYMSRCVSLAVCSVGPSTRHSRLCLLDVLQLDVCCLQSVAALEPTCDSRKLSSTMPHKHTQGTDGVPLSC